MTMKKIKTTLLSLALVCGSVTGMAHAAHAHGKTAKAAHKAEKSGKHDKHAKHAAKAGTQDKHRKLSAHQPASHLARAAVAPVVQRTSSSFATPGDVEAVSLHASSALVVDQSTGAPVLQKNPDAVLPIASISKLMTAMVVLDAGLDLNEVITITDADVDTMRNTRSRLYVGATLTRETAMLLALMSSDNRAAHALGRNYPGGIGAFVNAMNRKAHSLGMRHSNFEEPTGLSSNNVSTARDLARMVQAAQHYPQIRDATTTAEARVDLGTHLTDFYNSNALVRGGEWEIGLSKTGFISAAGRCLVMQARVANKPVIIVLLDSAGKSTRIGDANKIKQWMESASRPQDYHAG